ncbi:GNAT family N-acetyltransferase [Kribbella qitaiheensis]|uniref:GNAT family N-acetyltransferase n=1 Tax=Kribbella qitaiheensis TaxID=1544730 RepID=UPI001FEA9DD8|nr:GNAT family N-acetyltransferase [Kribbella qitaiheensis]
MVLPAGYSSRAATDADVEAIHELVAGTECELHGEAETAADGIKAVLSRPGFDPAVDTVVVHGPTGLAAWAWLNRGKRAQIDVATDQRGLGLGTALLDWAEARAAEVGTDWFGQMVDDKDLAGTELVRARGFEVLAVNWQLQLPMDEEPVVPALPEGITVRPFAPGDAAAAHLLIEDAFDEWQSRRKSYEEWAAMMIDRSSFAPELSPMAFAGAELIGAALCLDLPDSDEGYIEQLAVRADHRGKGLARTLLAVARQAFYRQGKRNLTLWTHSDTGALAMYERLGMTVHRSTTIHRSPTRAH